MADKKLVAVLRRLADETKRGNIAWSGTDKSDTFQAPVGNGAIRLYKVETEEELFIWVSVINAEGRVATRLNDEELASPELSYTTLDEMYEAAKSKALGIDKTLDSMLEALGDEA